MQNPENSIFYDEVGSLIAADFIYVFKYFILIDYKDNAKQIDKCIYKLSTIIGENSKKFSPISYGPQESKSKKDKKDNYKFFVM